MNYGKVLKIDPFKPDMCRGVELALGTAALGLGIVNSFSNSASQRQVNDAQIDYASMENEKNRQFNHSEAEIQREWQHNEWLNQYEKQASDWYKQLAAQEASQKRMFDYQAEYNSPSNQVRRMQSAGLNPSAVLGGQGSSGLVSAATGNYANLSPSVPTGGSVSGASASAPVALQPNLRAPMFDIGSLGSFLADFAKAYKDNRTLRPEMDLMAGQLSYIISQQAGQELSNAYQAMNNYIKNNTKDIEIYKAFLDLGVTYNEMALKGALADEASQQALLAKEETLLARMKKKLTKQQYLQALFYTQHLNETFDMDMKVRGSQVASNNASATYFRELGVTEHELRTFRVENMRLINSWQETENKLSKNRLQVSDETIKIQVGLMTKALDNASLLTDEMRERITLLEKEGKYYEIRTILNPIVNTMMSSMTSGLSSGSAAAVRVIQ